MKGATHYARCTARHPLISIHAPAKGATLLDLDRIADCVISIHAPAKGATKFVRFIRFEYRISIHAPAKGATRLRVEVKRQDLNFNPRSREGSDWQLIQLLPQSYNQFQSTLPRRERRMDSSTSLDSLKFQSTLPRRERRSGGMMRCELPSRFQSTLPRRERRRLSAR